MWTENNDGKENSVCSAANSMVVTDDRILAVASTAAAASTPPISNLNVNKSKKVHIGPKFVSVTQNVHNAEMIKGRILGLELVSSNNARRLRCSVAVFVCWAFLVASGLAIYLIYMALPNNQSRLDIEFSCPKYLWNIVKNSSRIERLSCVIAVMVLITCIALIAYFTLHTARSVDQEIDKSPHEWHITREMWLAQSYNYTHTTERFEPLMLVIIQHTVSSPCTKFVLCAAELRNMQHYFIGTFDYDIPYNFLIGNDGRVYEGRGWNIEGAHTFGYNRCSVGIGFIGDYREEMPNHATVTAAQLNRTRMLLDEGVRLGHLREDYLIVGAKDLRSTASPGSILYNAIQQWPNYDSKNRFHNLTCEQMYDTFSNISLVN